MRYLVLEYLINMSRTLIEASEYLSTAPAAKIQAEIHDTGELMIQKMQEVLLQHEKSLRSGRPLALFGEISKLWKEPSGTAPDLTYALTAFSQALPREVDYKVRAVFVAELGEKWDSLASVYACMRKDPRFDPVVVMEPVFRRVKWGDTVRQDVIYKDYLTPMGIPCLDYNKYSMEQDSPDLALICQPYESCTLPQFWPENIAKLTRLVYLPYFFTGVVQEDQISSMCQMPVFSHAWKVIGASENHKAFYSQYAPNGGNNMIVTGLPKLDGLATLRERGVPWPKGWEEKLKGKKVFLINIWYDLSEDLLNLLETFARAAENDPGRIAIIWRPHPMTDTVTKLYHPAIYDRYLGCKQRYRSGHSLILDEEVSFEPAFYYSDAMISGASSMAHQYLLMDKPLRYLSKKSSAVTLVDNSWMTHNGDSYSGNFLDHIASGNDTSAGLRKSILMRDLPLADGKSGERVCEALWNALHEESGILL